jgi:hypothetical protein
MFLLFDIITMFLGSSNSDLKKPNGGSGWCCSNPDFINMTYDVIMR